MGETSEPSTATLPPQQPPATEDADGSKWPGWPGDNVFKLIVPVTKVGSIIGRKGEFVKKLCDETRARVRVLDAPVSTADRVVLISGKEEPDSSMSPAMDAVIRLFKIVTDLVDDKGSEAAAFCSIKVLVASVQAVTLIGKQGSIIKTIQEGSGAVVRILPEDTLPSYATPDERIVEIHGEAFKVQKALELVLGHLRKFLHDHGVVAVFEKTYNATISQDQTADEWTDKIQNLAHLTPSSHTLTGSDPSVSFKQDYFERYPDLEAKLSRTAVSLYGSDPGGLSSLYSIGHTRAAAPIVTQITQTMQIPISYAEDIIGVAGTNIAYIRRCSGAVLTVQESSRGDEITVEFKGSASQIQTAQQLIQESMTGHRSTTSGSIYGKSEQGLSSSYSHLANSLYLSYASQSLGGSYTSSGLDGYNSFRF